MIIPEPDTWPGESDYVTICDAIQKYGDAVRVVEENATAAAFRTDRDAAQTAQDDALSRLLILVLHLAKRAHGALP